MKAIVGTILFVLFVAVIAVITYLYIKAMNQNIEAPIRAKGFKNYKEYKRYVKRRRRKAQKQIGRAEAKSTGEIRPPSDVDRALEERQLQKQKKREDKKLVDELYLRELDKHRTRK
jgi:hypothetical protein